MNRFSKYVKEKMVKLLIVALVAGSVAGNGTITVQAEEVETAVTSVSDGNAGVSGGDAVTNGNRATEEQQVAMIEVAGTTAEGTEAEKLLDEINNVTKDYSIYTEELDNNGHMQSDLAADVLNVRSNEIGGDLGYDYVDRDCYIGDINIADGATLDLGSATGRVIFCNSVAYTDENGVEHFKYTYKDAEGNYLTEYVGKNGQVYEKKGGHFLVVKTNADGSETVFYLKKDNAKLNGYTGEISALEIVDGEENITEGLEKIAEAAKKLAEQETSEGTKVATDNSRVNIHTEDSTTEVTVANITMAAHKESWGNSTTIQTEDSEMANQADTVQIYKKANQVCIINVTVSDATEETVIDLQKYTIHLTDKDEQIAGDTNSGTAGARENADKVVWNFGDFAGTIKVAGSILGRIIAPFAKIISNATSTGSAVSKEFEVGSGEWHSVSTPSPTPTATPKPTIAPTVAPTVKPTVKPTVAPTVKPTVAPTVKPTVAPTAKPTVAPTAKPTVAPTVKPTVAPTVKPTVKPTVAPTAKPTVAPTAKPTVAPTAKPTVAPTAKPTVAPTVKPTVAPTVAPTAKPTVAPTAKPTVAPTAKPTVAPTVKPTVKPTVAPTATPTVKPTVAPTATPTVAPTATPTVAPTATPVVTPSVAPTATPAVTPSVTPTATPAVTPSATPMVTPTATPTAPDDSDDSDDSDSPDDPGAPADPGTPAEPATPGTPGNGTGTGIGNGNADTPQVLGARRRRVVTIEDEAVPLADRAVLGASRRPQTGDDSDAWNLGFALSLTGLGAWLVIKRKEQ